MPNWCYNIVTIVAEQSIIDDLEEHKLDFEHYVPRPPEEEENWYDWNIENWGTKWSIADISIDRNDEEKITFEFATAWSPPKNFFMNLCRLYEKIHIELKYTEEGDVERGLLFFTKNNGQFKIREFYYDQPYNAENIEELENETPMETIELVHYDKPEKKANIDITL